MTPDRSLLKELHSRSGKEILDRILGDEDPQALIRSQTSEDFFWLIKKVGEEDCLPILELASTEQWQYLFDLEIWRKDRLDLEHASLWLRRLQQADCRGLVRWLFSEGLPLAFSHFYRSLEVIVINTEDDALDIPEGFFTLDGMFYIRIADPEYQESLEQIIRVMADEDFDRYHALMLNLVGVLPAEAEEAMKRMRDVRLAEHGFLPFEEAISVYAPLNPESFKTERLPVLPQPSSDEALQYPVPMAPLLYTAAGNRLTEVLGGIADPAFLERLRIEFAGLCNQILSADGLNIPDLDILIKTCRKAGRYLNLAIERLCGKDLASAEGLLKAYPLVSIFRVGFGLALKVKWEAERWMKEGWFYGQGLDPNFWGEPWGAVLEGLLKKRPQFYAGPGEGEEYRDFEWLSEIGESLQILRRLMVLDSLLDTLARSYPLDEALVRQPNLVFHTLLFNLWARQVLKLDPGFSGISLHQGKALFDRLRSGEERPPYRMTPFKEVFIKDLKAFASHADPEPAAILEEALSLVWEEFREEYESVPLNGLDGRFSRYLGIKF